MSCPLVVFVLPLVVYVLPLVVFVFAPSRNISTFTRCLHARNFGLCWLQIVG
jgi:hypothetical protein